MYIDLSHCSVCDWTLGGFKLGRLQIYDALASTLNLYCRYRVCRANIVQRLHETYHLESMLCPPPTDSLVLWVVELMQNSLCDDVPRLRSQSVEFLMSVLE